MKKLLTVLFLAGAMSINAAAVDGKVLLVGIGIGLGLYSYQGTKNHVVLPMVRAVQRTVRPIPQDKVDKANRKAEKARLQRQNPKHQTQIPQAPVVNQ